MDTSPSYHGCRFLAEIISRCVWLYFRFCLSLRNAQEMMLERGVQVSHEAIRLWTLKFGGEYARRLRRGSCGHGDTWHLDEVFCKINSERVYLWRAVDHGGADPRQRPPDPFFAEDSRVSVLPRVPRS